MKIHEPIMMILKKTEKFISHHMRQLANQCFTLRTKQSLIRISIYPAFPLGNHFRIATYSLLVKESLTF